MEIPSGRCLVKNQNKNSIFLFFLFFLFFSVPEIRSTPRRGTQGKLTNYTQGAIFNGVTYAPSTFYDKGLFDNREVGYIY
jgi:hypothetical protein